MFHQVRHQFSITPVGVAKCLALTRERVNNTAKEESDNLKIDRSNAALMSAAPELLASLLDLLDLMKPQWEEMPQFKEARALIARVNQN